MALAPEKTDSRLAVHPPGTAEELEVGVSERQGQLDALLHRERLDGLAVPLTEFVGHGSHAGSLDRKPGSAILQLGETVSLSQDTTA